MARARLIKPSFFTNEAVVSLPPETQLLFIGLWTLADREGRIEDRPLRIKMQIFPAANYDVNAMLEALHAAKLLIRYEANGGKYVWLPGFSKNQNLHPNEAPSVIPAYNPDNDEQCNITSEQDQNASAHEKVDTARALPSFPSLSSFPSIPSEKKDTPSECLAFETDRTAGQLGSKPAKSRKKPKRLTDQPPAWCEQWFGAFEDAYQLTHQCPYKRQRKDYIQLAILIRSMPEGWLTLERFVQGVENYFSSDLGTHTMADFGNRFGDFYRSPLDRFKVPIKRPESVNNAPIRRETDGERKRREVRESIAADFAAAGDHQAASRVLKGDSWTIDDRHGGIEPDGKLLGTGVARSSD